MRLKCLFWNAGRKLPDMEIASLATSTDANVIALAEYGGDGKSLLHALHGSKNSFYIVPTIGCERIRLLTVFKPNLIKHRREADRYTIKEIMIPGVSRLLLCIAHLPSKLHANDVDQLHSASYFKQDIEMAEAEANHSNTIVFGDFNMNPFDDGMISAAAMNSLPCLSTARREKRIISGRSHSFFYNPSWNLLGDFNGAPGTFFHKSPGYLGHYWNTLDQVMLRPAIAHQFDKTSFEILTKAGTHSLGNGNGYPTVSDHFPIFFSINLH